MPACSQVDLETLQSRLDAQGGAADQTAATPASLTTRERQVLSLLSADLSLREIEDELYISRDTAKTHTALVYRTRGLASPVAAVAKVGEGDLL